jgi:hypothetical protein
MVLVSTLALLWLAYFIPKIHLAFHCVSIFDLAPLTNMCSISKNLISNQTHDIYKNKLPLPRTIKKKVATEAGGEDGLQNLKFRTQVLELALTDIL